MNDLEFGVMYSRFYPVVGPGEFASSLQRLGFGSVWVGEGLSSRMPALDPIVCMTAMAGAAERILVGSCVILVPVHNPAILAKKIASLDVLSGGRIVFGIGVGGSGMSSDGNYAVTDTDERERGARCDDYLDVMIKLWSGAEISHRGRFFQAEDIAMSPVPVQRPHPPIWAGGDAQGMLRRAGRIGQGFVPVATGPEDYAAKWRRTEGYAIEARRDASEITPALHLYYHCAPGSSAEAHQAAERNLAHRYGRPITLIDDGRFAFGDEDLCAATIAAYRDVGVRHFVLNLACPLADVEAEVERFATRILPRFR